MAKVKFSLIAIKELEESSEWYEGRSDGLGKRFVNIVKETLIITARNPEAFVKKKNGIREVVVDTFPYLIVYEFDKQEDTLNILHVFHTSRNPKLKYKK